MYRIHKTVKNNKKRIYMYIYYMWVDSKKINKYQFLNEMTWELLIFI